MRYSLAPVPVVVAATSACVVLVLFCIAFVDRPAATWSHAHLQRT